MATDHLIWRRIEIHSYLDDGSAIEDAILMVFEPRLASPWITSLRRKRINLVSLFATVRHKAGGHQPFAKSNDILDVVRSNALSWPFWRAEAFVWTEAALRCSPWWSCSADSMWSPATRAEDRHAPLNIDGVTGHIDLLEPNRTVSRSYGAC